MGLRTEEVQCHILRTLSRHNYVVRLLSSGAIVEIETDDSLDITRACLITAIHPVPARAVLGEWRQGPSGTAVSPTLIGPNHSVFLRLQGTSGFGSSTQESIADQTDTQTRRARPSKTEKKGGVFLQSPRPPMRQVISKSLRSVSWANENQHAVSPRRCGVCVTVLDRS